MSFGETGTLNGQPPLVIGHRGASGYRPEHTLASYQLAIDLGADYIEPDLVLTKDGVPIARHEPLFGATAVNGVPVAVPNEFTTTNIFDHPEFASRLRTRSLDGTAITGFWADDFTLAEVKTLRARERIPAIRPGNIAFNDLFEIPTLQEVINLAKANSTAVRTVGIYPETKHPTFFLTEAANRTNPARFEDIVVSILHANYPNSPSAPVFIQSFEVFNLQYLHTQTNLRLIQLINTGNTRPYDFVVAGDPRTYNDLVTPAGLEAINDYAFGIGPTRDLIIPRPGNVLGAPTRLISDAHAAGLAVHAFTFRAENNFLSNGFRIGSDLTAFGNYQGELLAYLQLGLDGFFTDQSDLAADLEPMTVAAGDVTQTTAILWAHSFSAGPVKIEYTTSPTLDAGVTTLSVDESDTQVPVKVALTGLSPNTTYYYRATGPAGSARGKFWTPPLVGTFAGLSFGVSGDQRGELAPYPSIRNAADRELGFFLQFGDNIYADFPSPDLPIAQARTLAEYRLKNNEVYASRFGLNTFAALRSSTAILATIDDHEVTNDFAGGALRTSDPRFAGDTGILISDTETFHHGLQAFREYHPVADREYGATGDYVTAGRIKNYRFNTYGSDAATFVLDARSFRSPPLPAITNPNDPTQVAAFLTGSFAPGRTLLGAQQLADLKQNLLESQAAGILWKFIFCPEPVQNFGPLGGEDRYEGYAAERTSLLKYIDDAHISNVVFVTADFHGTVVNRLSYQLGPFQPQIQTNSFEIITGSVAFDKPFGPTIVDLGAALGVVDSATRNLYNSLPNGLTKESIVLAVVNGGLAGLGYNPISATANPLPTMQLLEGLYSSTNTYGWTEFNIDPNTHVLDVKTWGILPYSQTELEAAPASVSGRIPTVVSRFAVAPLSAEPYVPVGVSVARGGFVFNRRIQRFVQQVTLTNNGTIPVATPLALAIDHLSANVSLANVTGMTTVLAPAGSPYVSVSVGPDQLLTPGESVSVTLEFSNPGLAGISYDARVVAGSATP